MDKDDKIWRKMEDDMVVFAALAFMMYWCIKDDQLDD